MKILVADYILTCDDDFRIIKNGAICFDKKIIDIGETDKVIKNNPYAKIKYLSPNSVILPGLINTHVHLEFSANKTMLLYGDFIQWLQSVIKKRDKLKEKCNFACYEKSIDQMISSGVVAFGAVSSFGDDLKACVNSPQRVVYFNEILGSNPDFANQICSDFTNRLERSYDASNDTFIPAISIHSAYSTHPFICDFALNIAKKNNLLTTTHFMESKAEREWLDSGSGDFLNFLKTFMKNPKPMFTPLEFLNKFKDLNTIFVHGTTCKQEELEIISKIGSLSHCFVSNRILNNPLLNLKNVNDANINLSIGTDGLSSNISLNMWDELRSSLFAHCDNDLCALSKQLILSATKNGAKALNLLDNTELSKGKNADIISIILPDMVEDINQLPLELILHTKSIKSGYINGERYV